MGVNKSKKGLFEVEERMEMLRLITAKLPNVRVDSWQGLLVDYCRENDISAVAKGLRSVSDFDYELQMAQMNRELTGLETLLMANNPAYGFVSSSLVKEVAALGGDIEPRPAGRVRAAQTGLPEAGLSRAAASSAGVFARTGGDHRLDFGRRPRLFTWRYPYRPSDRVTVRK